MANSFLIRRRRNMLLCHMGTVTVAMDSDEETVKAAALALDKVQKATGDMTVVKTILVKNKLINLIVKPAK